MAVVLYMAASCLKSTFISKFMLDKTLSIVNYNDVDNEDDILFINILGKLDSTFKKIQQITYQATLSQEAASTI